MLSRSLLVLMAGSALGGCAAIPEQATPVAAREPAGSWIDLLTGYELMRSTLDDEAQLDKLGTLKRVALDKPPDKVLSIMAQISKAAGNTLEELDRYSALKPAIEQLPEKDGFGTELQKAMKEDSTKQLLERSPQFPKRLLISQAQALRLMVVLPKTIARLDPNKERQEWLQRVSSDYTKMYDAYLANLVYGRSNRR